MEGSRGAILLLELAGPSKIPALAEPWLLSFKATGKICVAMTPEDLGKSGIDGIGSSRRGLIFFRAGYCEAANKSQPLGMIA